MATLTEIQAALAKGLRVLKFFPAEAMGGIRALKAFGEVYREASFVPTGGVGPQNLAEYMRLSNVHACGGTWLAKSERIARGEFAEIAALAQEAGDRRVGPGAGGLIEGCAASAQGLRRARR